MNQQIADPALQQAAEHLIGEYGWLLLIAFLGILFKDAIHKAAEGLLICVGKDFWFIFSINIQLAIHVLKIFVVKSPNSFK